MIRIENADVYGWEAAIRGMRNPMNSWDKSDTLVYVQKGLPPKIGEADYELMMRLARNGAVHAKYRRMIIVTCDITAPLYWWKEFDTYKVGTVANSCSTMHKIHAKEFDLEDFSCEHLVGIAHDDLYGTLAVLNHFRKLFIVTRDKTYWWQMIQLLPSSYNQKRTVQFNYEVLNNILRHRQEHKLDEWREFCRWAKTLAFSEIFAGGEIT